MEGRIIAIRVSDADFEVLDSLKKKEKIGWNQLLLIPVETAYDVKLETSQPAVKLPKEVAITASAEVIVADKPAKGKKAKKAKVESDPPRTEEQVLAGEFPQEDQPTENAPSE